MRTVAIEEISEVIRGVTFSKKDSTDKPSDGFVPVLRAGNISDESLILDDGLVYVSRKKVSQKQLLQEDDIVICTSSGSPHLVGKNAISKQDWEGSFGAFCAGVRVNKKKANPKYVSYYLKSPNFRNWASGSSGVGIKNIRSSELKEFLVPLPSLDEQKRIAAILDQADALRQSRRRAITRLNELSKSIFYEMFNDALLDVENAINIEPEVQINPKLGREYRPDEDDKVSFVPMPAISEHEKRVMTYELRNYADVKKGYTSFKKNDLLVAKITPCFENGKIAVANDMPTAFGFGSTEFHVFRSANAALINFLYFYFQDSSIRADAIRAMKGAVGHKRVPETYFSSLKIPALSNEILVDFMHRTQKVREKATDLGAQLEKIENLFLSLQQRAFRGEL